MSRSQETQHDLKMAGGRWPTSLEIAVLHSTRRRAFADRWFPVTQVRMRPLSDVGADVVRYQLKAVVLHGGRSVTPCSTEGDLRTVSTVRTNLLSVATCRTTGRSERSDAPSHAPSATATQATPDALRRRSVTDPAADVVLPWLLVTRRHVLSCCNVATNTSLTATARKQYTMHQSLLTPHRFLLLKRWQLQFFCRFLPDRCRSWLDRTVYQIWKRHTAQCRTSLLLDFSEKLLHWNRNERDSPVTVGEVAVQAYCL